MEEIINIDGRQFKLTTDRPLTASEKEQAIADIRKQSGCGCGTKSLSRQANIRSMAPCTATGKTANDTITLTVTALTGVAPYTTAFFKDLGPGGGGRVSIPLGSVVGATGAIAVDGGSDSGVYTLTDADAAAADFGGTGLTPYSGVIQFIGQITDSCPTGALTCESSCELTLICPTPTCSFTVT